jgi:hypothetical protein
MLWFFIALQAMVPFIHAHAGAVQLNHSGFLHLHQGVHTDAAYHAVAADNHGVEIDVADGGPLRIAALDVAGAALPTTSLALPRAVPPPRPDAGLPAPPPRSAPLPHMLSQALAPPVA